MLHKDNVSNGYCPMDTIHHVIVSLKNLSYFGRRKQEPEIKSGHFVQPVKSGNAQFMMATKGKSQIIGDFRSGRHPENVENKRIYSSFFRLKATLESLPKGELALMRICKSQFGSQI